MISYTRPSRRVLKICLVCLLLVIALPSWAADKVRLRVDDYQIDAELLPHVHKIAARAKVKFTALEDLNIATFELHNGLRVSKVLDAAGKPLTAERKTQESPIRMEMPSTMPKDFFPNLTFHLPGVLGHCS